MIPTISQTRTTSLPLSLSLHPISQNPLISHSRLQIKNNFQPLHRLQSPMAADASATFQKLELIPALQHLPEHQLETVASLAAHDGLRFWQFMTGGSIGGMVEHMLMFSIDTIKTQMQALGSYPIKSATVSQALQSILKRDGPIGLYRG